jgi:elongation factor P
MYRSRWIRGKTSTKGEPMGRVYQTSDFRNGLKLEVNGAPWEIVYFQFVKPGKGTAFTRTKLKNMLTGSVIERTYRSGESLEAAEIEEESMQFLYSDDEFFHFMNDETYEQVAVSVKTLEDVADFLVENERVDVLFYKGRAVSVTLPNFISSAVVHCEPGVRGNTAQGATKPATLVCGATINVPLFINEGDVLKIDTRSREYVSRVKE